MDKVRPLPSKIGFISRHKLPDGSRMEWRVVDEIRRCEDGADAAEKIILLQRLRAVAQPDNEMFRFCYYIIGKKPKMKGKWVWGQYALNISRSDLEALLAEAREKQWITC